MALEIVLSVDISSDLVTGTLNDDTVYGGSNPARSTVRVFATANKMNSDNEIAESLPLTSDTGDPETVSSYTWTYTVDGWTQFLFVIIEDTYAGGTSYDIYDAVYDSSTDLVYRSKANANIGHDLSDSTWWELITDPSSLASNKGETNESLNIQSLVYNRVLTFSSQRSYGNFIADSSSECCGDCEESEAITDYKLLSLLVNGAILADERTEPISGEVICRRLQGIFGTC